MLSKWRLHIITLIVFIFLFGSLKLVWDNPKVILYFLLFILGTVAYSAIYLIVKSKLDDHHDAP